ncbi:Gfo/Idh/MocA family protein [Candidatus Uabimicrobium sp. HlEnr_7]|uniref:Gfo/Idh/MocA family protein n=1 Tax=Candidatus Uabimicrobium helgolandensis TaxID=3095367 RepID=UPI003555C952
MNTIGLIGCGHWGKFILRDLVSLNCEVWVVARSTSSQKIAKQHQAHHIVNSIEELPPDLEGYVVAVPTINHAEIIEKLIKLNKPIFVEKPMTPDLKTAQKITNAAENRVFVMDKWRYHPAIEKIAQWINQETLGKVQTIKSVRCQWGTSHTDVDPVWTLLPHELSIILHLLGKIPEPIWAHAEIINDNHFVSLRGLLGKSPACFVEVSTRVPRKQRGLTVSCENGSMMMEDPLNDHILVCRNGSKNIEKIAISTEYPLLRELRAFINHINNGSRLHSCAKDGLLVVKVVTQMRKMAKERVCL